MTRHYRSRRSLLLVALPILVAALPARAQPRAGEHPLIAEFRAALAQEPMAGQVGGAGRARVAAIDTSGTDRARPRTLMFLAADYAVRVFAPMALEARGRASDAALLRALAPVRDRPSARAARALLDRIAPLEPVEMPPNYDGPMDPCGYPLGSATSAVAGALGRYSRWQGPLSWATMGAACAVCSAIRAGADRGRVLDAAVALTLDLVRAARAAR